LLIILALAGLAILGASHQPRAHAWTGNIPEVTDCYDSDTHLPDNWESQLTALGYDMEDYRVRFIVATVTGYSGVKIIITKPVSDGPTKLEFGYDPIDSSQKRLFVEGDIAVLKMYYGSITVDGTPGSPWTANLTSGCILKGYMRGETYSEAWDGTTYTSIPSPPEPPDPEEPSGDGFDQQTFDVHFWGFALCFFISYLIVKQFAWKTPNA